jgi:hypothetical protein
MARSFRFACLALALPALALAQYPTIPISVDLLKPQREFAVRAVAGSTPVMRVSLLRDGVPYTQAASNGFSCVFYYAPTNYAWTVAVTSAVAVSNYCDLSFTAGQTATDGVYEAQIIVGDTNGFSLLAGPGEIQLDRSFAALPALVTTNTTPWAGGGPLGTWATAAEGIFQPVTIDLRKPQREFTLRIGEGTTPLIRSYLTQDGVEITNGTDFSGLLYYAPTSYAWAVSVEATAAGSNYLDFGLAPEDTGTNGTFLCQLFLTRTNDFSVLAGPGQITLDRSIAACVPLVFAGITTGDPRIAGRLAIGSAYPGTIPAETNAYPALYMQSTLSSTGRLHKAAVVMHANDYNGNTEVQWSNLGGIFSWLNSGDTMRLQHWDGVAWTDLGIVSSNGLWQIRTPEFAGGPGTGVVAVAGSADPTLYLSQSGWSTVATGGNAFQDTATAVWSYPGTNGSGVVTAAVTVIAGEDTNTAARLTAYEAAQSNAVTTAAIHIGPATITTTTAGTVSLDTHLWLGTNELRLGADAASTIYVVDGAINTSTNLYINGSLNDMAMADVTNGAALGLQLPDHLNDATAAHAASAISATNGGYADVQAALNAAAYLGTADFTNGVRAAQTNDGVGTGSSSASAYPRYQYAPAALDLLADTMAVEVYTNALAVSLPYVATDPSVTEYYGDAAGIVCPLAATQIVWTLVGYGAVATNFNMLATWGVNDPAAWQAETTNAFVSTTAPADYCWTDSVSVAVGDLLLWKAWPKQASGDFRTRVIMLEVR